MKNGDVETVLMELPTATEAYSLVRKMETAGLKEGVSLIWRQKESEVPQEEKKPTEEKKPSKEHNTSLIKDRQLSTTAANALINARRSKECKNYRQARSYYLSVLREYPENWEAFFYSTYYEAIEKADISQGATAIANCIKMVLKDIKKLKDVTEQNEAIKQLDYDLYSYFLSSYFKVINAYETSINRYVEARDRAYSVLPLGFAKLGEIDINLRGEFNRHIIKLLDMLILFGNELVSEFGKNEITTPINIGCHETAFSKAPCQYYADKLKIVNPSSPALIKYENRGALKKFWEKRDDAEKSIIGCGGCLFTPSIIFVIILVICKLLGIDPSTLFH